MLAQEEVGDLLPAALFLALTDFPHPPLDYRIHLTLGARLLARPSALVEEPLEPLLLDPAQPETHRLAVTAQTMSHRQLAQPLLIQLPSQHHLRLFFHFRSLLLLQHTGGNLRRIQRSLDDRVSC